MHHVVMAMTMDRDPRKSTRKYKEVELQEGKYVLEPEIQQKKLPHV